MKVADNAGALRFKCITIFGGFRRRYARLGELVGVVAKTRRIYSADTNKKILARKVKKKRKQKSKKVKPYIRPYLALLVATKRFTNRGDGSYIKFDENRSLTFSEPSPPPPSRWRTAHRVS